MSSMHEHRLRWIRVPVSWDRFDAVDGNEVAVRISYCNWSDAIAEVAVAESRDLVSVTLFERAVAGTYADGSIAAHTLSAVYACVEVPLQEPLGDRQVIDGATGRGAQRLPSDPEEPSDDWFHRRALNHGCPRWTP